MGDVEIEYTFTRTVPNALPGRELPEPLMRISPRFASVYNQAAVAQHGGLDEVAGTGYRRALEILVKDYLIAKDPGNRDAYCKDYLGNCIKKFPNNSTIQELARRANILGTDFAHYERRYEAGELQDLVQLVELVMAWIVLEEETAAVRERLVGLDE